MIEFGTVLQIVIAACMPFVLYILHGIRKNVHDLRDQLAPLSTDTAVLKSQMADVRSRLLGVGGQLSAKAGVR